MLRCWVGNLISFNLPQTYCILFACPMKFGYFDYCLILTFSFSIGLQLQLSSNVRLAYISSFCFYLQLSCIAAFVLARLHSYIVKDPPSHIEVERNVSSSSAFFSNNTVDVIQLTEVPMVVDFGSHSTKVGFAGADAPIKIIAPSADNQIAGVIFIFIILLFMNVKLSTYDHAGWGAKMESIWEQLYDGNLKYIKWNCIVSWYLSIILMLYRIG